MNVIKRIGLAALLGLLAAGRAEAGLVFDNSIAAPSFSSRSAGSAPLTVLTVTSTTQLSAIAVNTIDSTSTNYKFLIFDDATGNLLFSSAVQTFGADAGAATFKTSAPLSFTLAAGNVYDIGAVTDQPTLFAFNFTTHTENGLSSTALNSNVFNFTTPVDSPRSGSGNIELRLFSPDAPGPAPVPEPATFGMAAVAGLAGVMAYRRRRRAAG